MIGRLCKNVLLLVPQFLFGPARDVPDVICNIAIYASFTTFLP